MSRSVAASPTLGLAAFALVLALGSCERSPLLRIGVIAYEYEADHNIEGFSTDKASRLAAREINAGGRIRVELETVMVDDAPESSVSAVSLLANRRGAAVIVGPSMSRQAIAAGAAAERARIPLISSVSSNPDTTRERRYVFRMCYLDPVQARSQARFALERFAPRSASLIWYESDPSSSTQAAVIAQEMRAGGRPLRATLAISPDDPDWEGKIEALGTRKDELLFLPTDSDFAAKAGRSARGAGFKGVLVGGDGWDRESMKGNPDFEGAYMTTNYWSGQASPGNVAFVAAYTAYAGRQPGDTAALTYDAVGMLASVALRLGTSDSESLRAGLADGSVYRGVAGAIRYAGSGDPEREVVFLRFSGGRVEFGGSK